MSFDLNCFKFLVDTYATWELLSAYLASDDGGKLRIVSPADSPYAIIRYTRDVSDMAVEHVRCFKSVVWHKESNRPVCVAPVKHSDSVPSKQAVRVMDSVDGTMVNAWRDATGVHLSTRTSVGATGKFYSDRSFAELFGDAVRVLGGTDAFLESVLEVGSFVSFVLQHPEHKLVASIPAPRLYVVYHGSVAADGSVRMSCEPADWPDRLKSYAPQVINDFVELDGEVPVFKCVEHTQHGIVYQSVDSSLRWRSRNGAYTFVRNLRGQEPTSMGRFVRLRATGMMKQYLAHFSEENNEMWTHEKNLRERTQELYNAYCAIKKGKTLGMKQIPYTLRPHVFALHGLYLASVAGGQNESVVKNTVVNYVNNLAQEDQLKLLAGDSVPFVVPENAYPAAQVVA